MRHPGASLLFIGLMLVTTKQSSYFIQQGNSTGEVVGYVSMPKTGSSTMRVALAQRARQLGWDGWKSTQYADICRSRHDINGTGGRCNAPAKVERACHLRLLGGLASARSE